MQALASWAASGARELEFYRKYFVSFPHRRVGFARRASSVVVAATKSSVTRSGGNKKRKVVVPVEPVIVSDDEDHEDEADDEEELDGLRFSAPAGFILDNAGEVAIVAPADKRLVKVNGPKTERCLECVIRRAFHSTRGEYCLLLYPVDTPVHILRFEEENGGCLQELSEEELEEVIPEVEYALAKKRMTLVLSGICLTARGSFMYNDNSIMDIKKGELLLTSRSTLNDKRPSGGVEVTTFAKEDDEFVIFTPFEPVQILACRDESTGSVTLASKDLQEDENVQRAIAEEKYFLSTAPDF